MSAGAVYITSEGDMLDAIAWKHYGRHDAVIAIYEASYRLSRLVDAHDLILPAGIEIFLPDLAPQSEPRTQIKLWG